MLTGQIVLRGKMRRARAGSKVDTRWSVDTLRLPSSREDNGRTAWTRPSLQYLPNPMRYLNVEAH
jgi:hypothetical protein